MNSLVDELFAMNQRVAIQAPPDIPAYVRFLMLKSLLMIAALSLSPGLAAGATFVVNSTADVVDAAPGNGVCATAGAVCIDRERRL